MLSITPVKQMPDVAAQHTSIHELTLQWVGMEKVAVPLHINLLDGSAVAINAQADIYVSLDDADTKGIHMSRLYLNLHTKLANNALTQACILDLLQTMVASQQGISQGARINLQFDLTLSRPSLLSAQRGYQSYPININAELINGQLRMDVDLTVAYSSTCPCSASLSRQLYAEAIDNQFGDNSIDKQALLAWLQSHAGSIATPHSQRSYAYIKLHLGNGELPDMVGLIDRFEKALGTPVQTAVKREDEQEFARLNAENLMFCEDAARRVKHALETMPEVEDYWFKVEHQESLHAHNAVVVDQRYRNK